MTNVVNLYPRQPFAVAASLKEFALASTKQSSPEPSKDKDVFDEAPGWAIAYAMDGKGYWYWFSNVPTWYDSVGVWACAGRVAKIDGWKRGDGDGAQFSLVIKG